MPAYRLQRGSVLAVALLFILQALAVATPALAGTDQWTSNGPYGGFVAALVVDPKTPATYYAAGFSGVYKTTNAGANWTRASNGIADPSVGALAIDPVTPSTLYAGSVFGGKVVKSIDGATTWTTLDNAPTLVVALAINPQVPATLYAAQDQSGLHKSSDGGATWARIGTATLPSAATFKALVVDPKTPTTIYAGEKSRGVFKSTDGGATWAAANGGLTGSVVQVLALAIDPQTPSTLYVSANTSGSGAGVFKSVDGGANWTKILNDASSIITYQAIAVDPQVPATIYVGSFGAGLTRSNNGGTSFTTISTGLPKVGVNVIAVDPLNSANVFVGLQDGVFASPNAGATWNASNNGLALTTVTTVAVDPVTPTTVYAGTKYSGIFKSVNGGDSWASISTGIGPTGNLGCNTPAITSLAIDPGTPTTLYAGTSCTQDRGVLKSANGGASWTNASSGLPAYVGIAAVAVDPQLPATLFAGSSGAGLFQSTDGGAHWSANAGMPGTSHITDIAFAVAGAASAKAGSNSVAAVSATDSPIHISNNHGVTFEPLPLEDYQKDCIDFVSKMAFSYALDTANPLSEARLFRLCISPRAIEVGPNTLNIEGTIYEFQPFKSTAGVTIPSSKVLGPGATKASSPRTLLWTLPVECVPASAINANVGDANTFLVGAACGVVRITNDGTQVTKMSTGLPPNLQIISLATTPTGADIYAGAQSGGVWRYTPSAAPATPVPVIEFYNAALDHYFITWVPDEIAKLDAGTVIKGWARTGQTFRTYTTVEAGTSPVCRFYIPPGLGDSHFFGRGTAECTATAAKNPTFVNEDPDFMNMFLPAAGVCPAGTTQVYRVFSNRPDANHRYMTDMAIRTSMVAKGWLAEGDGADLVVMCAP